jgi:hypothetical protein
LRWDNARWRQDDTLQAFDLARHVCREAAAECEKRRRKRRRIPKNHDRASRERWMMSDKSVSEAGFLSAMEG